MCFFSLVWFGLSWVGGWVGAWFGVILRGLNSYSFCFKLCLPVLSVCLACLSVGLSVCVCLSVSAILRLRSRRPLQADGGNERAGARGVPGDASQPHLPNRWHGGNREPLRSAGGIDDIDTHVV